MNYVLYAALLATVSASALAADVGVSVSISQPGLYGRIDIGNAPAPQVIYDQPVIIYRERVRREPIYLHVPPGHAKNWRKHCQRYNACGRPVYFVRDEWYNDVYVPHRREHGDRGDRREDNRRDDDRRDGDNRRDGDRGEGNRGEKHGHGHHKDD